MKNSIGKGVNYMKITSKINSLVLGFSVLCFGSNASASTLTATETRAVVEVITKQVAKPNSLIRAAILNGAEGTQGIALGMRAALGLRTGQKLTLEAAQTSKLASLMQDKTTNAMQLKFIAQGLNGLDAAIKQNGLPELSTDAKNIAKLSEAFKTLASSNSGTSTGETQVRAAKSAGEVSSLQQQALVSSIVVQMNKAVDKCADGSCELSYQQSEINIVKEALGSEFFRAILKDDGSCMADWTTPGALSSVAEGGKRLSAHLTELRQKGLTQANIEQAETAFLEGAANALVDLKIVSSRTEAFNRVCQAFNEAPCELLIPAAACAGAVAAR